MLCPVCLNYVNGLLFAVAFPFLLAAVVLAVYLLRGGTFDAIAGVPFEQPKKRTRRRR